MALSAETPLTAPEGVWFKDDSYQQHTPTDLKLAWLAGNLTMNKDAQVMISLWGYREISIYPEIIYIDMLVVSRDGGRGAGRHGGREREMDGRKGEGKVIDTYTDR